jgi:ABC-type dipeptide/oligopeptide/nickel transport system permease component
MVRIGKEDWAMLMRYTTTRIVQLIPLILVVTIVVFFVMMIVPGDPVMVMLGAVDGAQVHAKFTTRCACVWDWTSRSLSNISIGYRTYFKATWAPRSRIGPQH